MFQGRWPTGTVAVIFPEATSIAETEASPPFETNTTLPSGRTAPHAPATGTRARGSGSRVVEVACGIRSALGVVAIVVQSGIIRRDRIFAGDMKPFLHAGAAVLLVWGLRAEAQFVDPSLRWRTLDTAHFSVHFAEHTLGQARTVAEIAETVYPRVTG